MIYGNTVGGSGGSGIGKTFILQDEAGNELVGIVTDKNVIFDASPNDIRLGKIAANQDGVITGEKVIPPHYTTSGYKMISKGATIELKDFTMYDYTKLIAVICTWGGSLAKSVSAQKISINDKVYNVNSSESLADVIVIDETKSINFGITNDSGAICVVHYMTYKEED